MVDDLPNSTNRFPFSNLKFIFYNPYYSPVERGLTVTSSNPSSLLQNNLRTINYPLPTYLLSGLKLLHESNINLKLNVKPNALIEIVF